MKMNLDIFPIQTWILQTIRAQNLDEKKGIIFQVSFFSSWVRVLELSKIVDLYLSKKSKSFKVIYVYPSERPHQALS